MKYDWKWLTRVPRQEQLIGILSILFCLLLLLIWIPFDIDSGIASKVRGRSKIGDAMAPTVAAVILGVAGLSLLFSSKKHESSERIEWSSIVFILGISALILTTCFIMAVFGPLIVSLSQQFITDLPDYRSLRNAIPWKYLGLLAGGSFMLVSFFVITGYGSWQRRIIVAFLATLALAMAYDLPFDDLLLPPNGDV